MKVEPSGVIMTGVCEVQTPVCQAREPAPITAVWTLPARNQVAVCRACLEECVRDGEWEIPGARIQRRFDIAVYDEAGRIQLVVEVKSRPSQSTRGEVEWATAIHRNLITHAGIPAAPNFLLIRYPDAFFVWVASTRTDVSRTPDYVYFTPAVLRPYRDSIEDDEVARDQERVVAAWLEDLLRNGHDHRREHTVDASDALNALLMDLIRGGTVVRQALVAA
jgi:hypothetical protein